jgi:lipopolysaccharide transport system permease protein
LIASYKDWDGVSSFGNRFFVSLTPIFVVGLGVFLATVAVWAGSRSRAWAVAGVLVGISMLWNAGQRTAACSLSRQSARQTMSPRSEQVVAAQAAPIPLTRIAPRTGWFALDLREVWDYRELLYFFVWRDLKVRYKQTAIGAAWAVLQPFLTMLVFSLFFGRLAKMSTEGLPTQIFYYCGLLPWTYFATAMQNATAIVVEQQRVITKVYFPRVILPISAILSPLADFAISFAMFIALMVYFHIVPTRDLEWLPAFLLLAVLTALGVGLWLSALNALYRDVRYVVPFLVQFWLFASPIAYSSSIVPQRWRLLYGLNPMAGVVEGFRWSLTGRGQPPGVMAAASTGAVVLVVLGGLMYYHAMESTIADVV